MDSSSRATLVAGVTATAETRSRGQSDIWDAFWGWCTGCLSRARQREALSSLDDRLLDDIGVTRQQANVEAAKPFWK